MGWPWTVAPTRKHKPIRWEPMTTPGRAPRPTPDGHTVPGPARTAGHGVPLETGPSTCNVPEVATHVP
jgi:hypothetical protein